MVKITKLFALPKFGSRRGSTSASLKIGEILAIRKNLACSEGKFSVKLTFMKTQAGPE